MIRSRSPSRRRVIATVKIRMANRRTRAASPPSCTETSRNTRQNYSSPSPASHQDNLGAFEQALVGVALGYSDENVAHYVRKMNEEDQLSDEDVLNLIETAKNEVEALCSCDAETKKSRM